ncbi:MAG: class I SAM-dependent methyltransferase [Sciscionella sp.]
MSEEFDKGYWEDRYRGRSGPHGMEPNPQLVAEIGDLTPGTALDAGCGQGTETIWLASHGWQVTAVDIAATALRHAREHAESLGADITDRIEWVEADMTGWTPTEEHFDLVCTHYAHPAGPRDALFGRLAGAVAPGGTLLIVGHHPSGPQHASTPEAYFTAEQIATDLDADRWDVAVAETRYRTVTTPHSDEIIIHDAVLRAHKRP